VKISSSCSYITIAYIMYRRLFWNSGLWIQRRKIFNTVIDLTQAKCNFTKFKYRISKHQISDLGKSISTCPVYCNRFEDPAYEVDDEAADDHNPRTVMHYDSNNPVINKLQTCTTVNDVLNTIDENKSTLKKEYMVQSVLTLWYLQMMFVKIQTQMQLITDLTEIDYTSQLKEEKRFQFLLKNIEESCGDFNIDELTWSLLYLSKMDVGAFYLY